jgi:hypothetical protein
VRLYELSSVLLSTYGLMLRDLLASRLLPQLTKELAPLTHGAMTPDAALLVSSSWALSSFFLFFFLLLLLFSEYTVKLIDLLFFPRSSPVSASRKCKPPKSAMPKLAPKSS